MPDGSGHVSWNRPAMYGALADWFHLLTAPAEYEEEAATFLALLREDVHGPLETLLELGAGGGNTASHLRRSLRLTLTDLSGDMLRQSRSINPDCEHVVGDMRSLRLGRLFDAVLVQDAVAYMTTVADLRAAMETAFVHLRAGGVALFAPDAVTETWGPATEHGGHDGADGRSLRYLEWTFDPDPTDTTVVTDFAILIREADGTTRMEHDRHVEGLFARSTWVALLRDVGFEARRIEDRWERDLFVARKPGSGGG